jgi:cystathionine beta-lyase/cystathionine gamma-synthase
LQLKQRNLTLTGDTLARCHFDEFAVGLTLRGIRSLAARMPLHCANALAVATFLESHSKVVAVYYPGLESHPGHSVAKVQMNEKSVACMSCL